MRAHAGVRAEREHHVVFPRGFTGVFQQQVEEFKARIDALNRQFEPRVKDVQGLADKINALETTLKSQSGVLAPAKVAEMTENLESMKRDYQRKGEDLQAEAGRARDQEKYARSVDRAQIAAARVRAAIKAKGLEISGGRDGSLHVLAPYNYDVQFANDVEENAFRQRT